MPPSPPRVVPVEEVQAHKSGLVYTLLASAITNAMLLVDQADPAGWKGWTTLGLSLCLIFLPVIGAAWFNRKSIVPPGRSTQKGESP